MPGFGSILNPAIEARRVPLPFPAGLNFFELLGLTFNIPASQTITIKLLDYLPR